MNNLDMYTREKIAQIKEAEVLREVRANRRSRPNRTLDTPGARVSLALVAVVVLAALLALALAAGPGLLA
jgi:hypothetical protein